MRRFELTNVQFVLQSGLNATNSKIVFISKFSEYVSIFSLISQDLSNFQQKKSFHGIS